MADLEELVQHVFDMQAQLAYQEDAVRELNDALALQQREILVLRRQLQLLKQRQDDMGSEPAGPDKADEPPPHY